MGLSVLSSRDSMRSMRGSDIDESSCHHCAPRRIKSKRTRHRHGILVLPSGSVVLLLHVVQLLVQLHVLHRITLQVPTTAAFTGPATRTSTLCTRVNSQRFTQVAPSPRLLSLLYQSTFPLEDCNDDDNEDSRYLSSSNSKYNSNFNSKKYNNAHSLFFANKQQQNNGTSTDLLSPQVREWTKLMSNSNGEESLWEAYSRRMRGGGGDGSSNSTFSSGSSPTSSSTSTAAMVTQEDLGNNNTTTTTSTSSTTPMLRLTLDDEHQIANYWQELQTGIHYLPVKNHPQVYHALRVAYECHLGQMRKSGEPFIVHPVQVSVLLASLKMDTETIVAGLLHDTVEDTDMTFERVEQLFGPVVRSIVEGETKVSKLPKLAFCGSSSNNGGDEKTKDYSDPTTATGGGGVNGDAAVTTSAEENNNNNNNNNYDEQAENLRQMFVAMTEDYRIIIVKLADRLHNMRTLQHMKPAKQIKISRETLDIFAPLAHRMGIWQFKSELEDISFQYLYPQEYKRLNRKLQTHEQRLRSVLERSQHLLRDQLHKDTTLKEQAASVEVVGRTKEIYSLWHKMETKEERNLDQIGDVVALRVIITPKPPPPQEVEMDTYSDDDDDVDDGEEYADGDDDDEEEEDEEYEEEYEDDDDDHDFKSSRSFTTERNNNKRPNSQSSTNQADRGVWLCYHVLGLVQHLPGFQPVPTRVKDYISFPKPNGYQSLHTAVMLQGQTIEVQIRTSTMHQVAEYGMASHWAYTDSKRMPNADVYNTPWLSSIKEWQKDRISSRDFVESVRRELLGKRVFVFLRNGKILNLARGATAIDAAFQIHTEIGLEMHGVEINGKPVGYQFSFAIFSGASEPHSLF
jgi:(p)ppGpp synthase/HD superfamily hydrolase